MKTRKRKLLSMLAAIMLAAALAFTATGCNTGKKNAVGAPVITLTGNTVSWQKVEKAEGYAVNVGSTSVETAELSYTLKLTAPGSFDVTVKAFHTVKGKKVYGADSNKVTYVLNATKLNAPVIQKIGGMIQWNAVENADGYRVYVNEICRDETEETSWTFDIAESGIYKIAVRAVSANRLYTISDDSNELTIQVGDVINLIARVTDAPYDAAGDGKINDRAAIQQAIDDVNKAGGGTVVLAADKTFLTGNIIIRDNVNLHFEDGAVLKQSPDEADYVKQAGGSYEEWLPEFGMNLPNGEIAWNHTWLYNFPFVYGPEGTKNVKITGNGTITMMEHDRCYDVMHITPIGFYRVSNFEISDIAIAGYNSNAMLISTCSLGLIKNITIGDYQCSCNDGISMVNSQDIRITGCVINSGDDSLYVCSNYNDPRGKIWWSTALPQPSKNIEFDNNYAHAGGTCKGFSFILFGALSPDLSRVEISNVYVHDNEFNSAGVWGHLAYAQGNGLQDPGIVYPVKNIRWENNTVSILMDFWSLPISDSNYFNSMREMHNGDFDEYTGEAFWVQKKNQNKDSAGVRYEQDNYYGYIQNLDAGDAKIYEGLYLEDGQLYDFSAKLRTSGAKCRMFVRSLETQELIAEKEFGNTEWADVSLRFSVPAPGNYHIGIERGNATSGWANIDDARLKTVSGLQSIFTEETPLEFCDDAVKELGTKFSVTASGSIAAVRIYTGETENGAHTVRIWDSVKGTVIAGPYIWNMVVGVEGWREYELPEAVRVKRGVDYIVSVSTGADKVYAKAIGGFASPISGKYLTTYTGSGVYSDTSGAMPSSVDAGKSNYFRDVVFSPDEQTIFTAQVPTNFNRVYDVFDAGVIFMPDVDGFITKVRLYTHEDDGSTRAVRIWDYETQTLIAGPYEWIITAGIRGWREFELPAPVLLTANNKYIASVSNPAFCYYLMEIGAYAFYQPINNGNLFTFVGSGVSTITLGEMPANVWNNQNFFRDVCFVPLSDNLIDEMITDGIADLRAVYDDITWFNVNEIRSRYGRVSAAVKLLSPEALGMLNPADVSFIETVGTALEAFDEYNASNQTIFTTQVPSVFNPLTSGMELGVIFKTDIDGLLTKVRLYTHESDGTVHAVRIWDYETATLIAGPYSWTVASGIRGWQEFELPEPVLLTANNRYIVSVSTVTGCYSPMDQGAYAFKGPINRGNLITFMGSGLYSETIGQMPVNSYMYSNYFRDVVFVPSDTELFNDLINEVITNGLVDLRAAYGEITWNNASGIRSLYKQVSGAIKLLSPEALGMLNPADVSFVETVGTALEAFDEYNANNQTIFTTQIPTVFQSGQPGAYELGVLFKADIGGFITKIRMYTHEAQSGVHEVRIWDYEKGILIAGTYSWTITAGIRGWREFELPVPVPIAANNRYVAVVSSIYGGYYTAEPGGFNAPVKNGHLTTFVGSGISNGTLGVMPNSTYNNQNFFRDVVFVPSGSSLIEGMVTEGLVDLRAVYDDITWFNVNEIRSLYNFVSEAVKLLSSEAFGMLDPADVSFIETVGTALEAFDEYNASNQTIFTTQVPSVFNPLTSGMELGVIFKTNIEGLLTKVRLYTHESDGTVHTVRIWDYETATLIAGPYSWTVTSGIRGWQEFELPEPVLLTANNRYIVSVSTAAGCYSPMDQGAYAFTGPINRGNLITFMGSGLYSETIGQMPTSSYMYSNYFRDVIFVPSDTE